MGIETSIWTYKFYLGTMKYKIIKGKVYIDSLQDAPKEVKVQEGKRGGLYYESKGKIPKQEESRRLENKDKEDFLYTLQYNYIVDFNKKDPKIFENFYENYPKELRDNHSFLAVIGDISNNLPKEVVYNISKIPIQLLSESRYSEEARGYWAAVYDHDYKYIALNKEVYQSLSRDYHTQEQYHRVLLHEYAHRLIYDSIISEQMTFELWDTKERVSTQARLDYNENTADSFAAFLMSLDDEMYAEDLKEEFPKTYQIWVNWLKEVNYEI